jgi:hypothetical protein
MVNDRRRDGRRGAVPGVSGWVLARTRMRGSEVGWTRAECRALAAVSSAAGSLRLMRGYPGNDHALDRLREIVGSGQAIAFVGAGASAGLYPLWGELIRLLISEAERRGCPAETCAYWRRNAL